MMYRTQYLSSPCRNFHMLGYTGFTDPKDGRAKVAMVSFADFTLGSLYLVDPRTQEVEHYTLPLDEGAWAVNNWQDKAIIIGTCAQSGCIHKFDLETRTFAEPLRTETETYIWTLAEGCDGCFYGGTYGNCHLVKYDPAAHVLTDLGRVCENKKNLYSRYTAAKDGYILIDVQNDDAYTAAYSIADGTFCRAADIGITESAQSLRALKDPRSEYGALLPDGSLVMVKGQSYLFWETDSTEPVTHRIPGEAPVSGIFAMEYDGKGGLWGATAFGMTMFRYDIEDGTYYNTVETTLKGGGEIYGIVHTRDKFYMTSYSAGFHLGYDPAKPFVTDQNPYVIHRAGPEYIRPHARSVIGPKGNIWTGFYAKYGTYGGALTRMDIETEEVTLFEVENRTIADVAADETYVYYATHGNGNGLPTLKEAFKLVKVDSDCNQICSVTLPEGVVPENIYVFDGKLYLCALDALYIYNPDTLSLLTTLPLPSGRLMLRYDGKLLVFGGKNEAYLLDGEHDSYEKIADTTFPVFMARTVGDTVYYACGTELWKLTKE